MLENTFLTLNGYGYLHDIQSDSSGECHATLNLIHQFNGSQIDDLWVKCQFDEERFPIFARLAYYLDKNKTVLLKFDAKYAGFQQCYAELSKNNHFIVYLHGELLNIHEYSINGARIVCCDNQDIQDSLLLTRCA